MFSAQFRAEPGSFKHNKLRKDPLTTATICTFNPVSDILEFILELSAIDEQIDEHFAEVAMKLNLMPVKTHSQKHLYQVKHEGLDAHKHALFVLHGSNWANWGEQKLKN